MITFLQTGGYLAFGSNVNVSFADGCGGDATLPKAGVDPPVLRSGLQHQGDRKARKGGSLILSVIIAHSIDPKMNMCSEFPAVS